MIGSRRILFDLWGETVNTASRMQASGIPGRIQIAESTMQRVSDRYRFTERLVQVKGLGELKAFLLDEGAE